MTSKHLLLPLALVVLVLGAAACAKQNGGRIRGTRVPDNDVNRALIERLETYRQAVEARDAEALVLMASPEYWEDRGTVEAKDDYGFEGLRTVLASRFQLASEVRYSLRYDKIRRVCPGDSFEAGCRAHVEVQIDASFTVNDAQGNATRRDKRDQNELVLVWTGDKWLITSGM
jgi:hypothetical protein